MTTQTWQKVEADYFADCSGDSILAPLTGAEFRFGRESKYEFDEEISVTEPDSKTMGNSCLIQARKFDHEVTFKAPSFATKLTKEDVANRRPNLESSSENFWYLELGGDRNTIKDAETIRDELVALAYGMWDYIKNAVNSTRLANSISSASQRGIKRLIGDYYDAKEISADTFSRHRSIRRVALTTTNPAVSGSSTRTQTVTPKPYKIPLSVLYSKNIENLWFAGRNKHDTCRDVFIARHNPALC